MFRLLFLLPFASLISAATCTLSGSYASLAASSGHWTGGCATIPGVGDSATVANGYALVVANGETWDVGPDISSGTAINLGTTGQLYVDAGGVLKVRGNISVGSGTYFVFTNALFLSGSLIFYPPSGVRFSYAYTQDLQTRLITGTNCTITTDLSRGGLGSVLGTRYNYDGGLSLTGCAVSNMGDASTPWASIGETSDFQANAPITLHGNTFTNCGSLSASYNYVASITGNTWAGSLADPLRFDGYRVPVALTGNVFDRNPYIAPMSAGNTIQGNYFGATGNSVLFLGDAGDSASFAYNFLRVPTYTPWSLIAPHADYDYIFWDLTGADNPHFTVQPASTVTASNLVFDSPDNITTDTGEAFDCTTSPVSPVTQTLSQSVLLCSKTGAGIAEIGSLVGAVALGNLSYAWDHNTVCVAPRAAQVDEGGATSATIASMRSNVIFGTGIGTGIFYKLQTLAPSSPRQDVCTNCDYNIAYGAAATDPACPNCTNQGRSYASKFTATPGAHDPAAAVSPYLADTNRRLATWYTAYLGLTCTVSPCAWTTSHAYSVGDVVLDSASDVYAGAPVAYRCTVAHTAGASTEPDVGASWRSDWEYASLYSLRNAIAGGVTYTDGALGCTACYPVQALIRWVQRGFAPQNPVAWKAGHDGADIGALDLPMAQHLFAPMVTP